jgi:DNA-binding NarL/FixJ family response regulator
MGAGGRGYLPKIASEEEIIRAILRVSVGGIYISPQLCPRQRSLSVLPDNEREAVRLVSLGYIGNVTAGKSNITPVPLVQRTRRIHKTGRVKAGVPHKEIEKN